jgi:hypothetical protein
MVRLPQRMPDFLSSPFADGPNVDPWQVLIRLLAALLLGAAMTWVYRRTTAHPLTGSTFPLTLFLLPVLIAMVTQVVGDNVARAFSLVGTLSIVRFRTVVRDTRDTAFVIFGVVLGMAVGARNLWVAGIGFAVIGGAVFVAAAFSRRSTAGGEAYLLTLRVSIGTDADLLLAKSLGSRILERKAMSVETVKQRTCLEVVYELHLAPAVTTEDVVRALNIAEGVLDVRVQRRGYENG